jgi:hypothetical protein
VPFALLSREGEDMVAKSLAMVGSILIYKLRSKPNKQLI